MKKYFMFIAIAASVLFTACNSAATKSESNDETTLEAAEHHHAEQHAEFYVGGSCDMCTDRIEETVKAIEGVTLAVYNLDEQQLHIHFDESQTSFEAINEALAAVGHDTDTHKADDDVYAALPGCCHYRK